MTTEENALLAAIGDNPEDDTARLVLADYLEENGKDTMRNVPVFELGEYRGFNYSSEWAAQAVANFNALVALFNQAIATETTDQATIDDLTAQVAALTADQATAIATLGNITPQPGEVLPTP